MSESTTRQRIAAMCGEINGIRTAFPQIPRTLQDAQLPASVVFPGRATHDKNNELGEEMISETRIYRIVLYVTNAAFDTSGASQIAVDPFFDSVLDHFAARPGLELNSQGANQAESAWDAELLNDGGFQVGPYPLQSQGEPAKDYVQIQWDLQVKEIIPIDYQD